MSGRGHLTAHRRALAAVDRQMPVLARWGNDLSCALLAGGRLLLVGNGGSAAQAEHLAAELVGRYVDERTPLAAIALHSDGSTLTAITNDYGIDEAFARAVRAHGRPGDTLMALSTSGESPNVLAAAAAARRCGLRVLALTGAAPNSLTDLCDEAVSVAEAPTAIVQELHLVALHLVCDEIDRAIREGRSGGHLRQVAP